MAKGTLVFEFVSLEDLRDQMQAQLRGLGLATFEQVAPTFVALPTIEEMAKYADKQTAGKTASAIAEDAAAEVVKATAEAVVPALKEAMAAAQTAAATPEQAAPQPPPPAGQDAPALTLETLGNAPYPELLAFCDAHPEVGVNTATCQAAFFRKLVEMKIKTYLETK